MPQTDKDKFIKEWKSDIDAGNDIILSIAKYPELSLKSSFGLLGIDSLIIQKPILEMIGPDNLLLKGKNNVEGAKIISFQLLLYFDEEIFTAIRYELKDINKEWLRQRNFPELPGELSKLTATGIERTIIEYSSEGDEFCYKIVFADVELDLFSEYCFSFRKPVLKVVFREGACQLVSVTVATDFLGRERDFSFRVPFSKNESWEIELLDETNNDIKLSDAVKQIETTTSRSDLSSSIPTLITDQLSNIAIIAMRFACPYSLKGPLTFSVTLSSYHYVELLPGITLSYPQLTLDSGFIGGELKFSIAFKGAFFLGDNVKLGVGVFLSNDISRPWNFHIEGIVDLENIKLLEKLPFGLDLSGLNFPADIAQIHSVTLRRLDFMANLKEKKISEIEFDVAANCELQFVKGVRLANPRLYITYKPGESLYDALDGSLSGELFIGKSSFFGSAVKSGRNWILTAGTGIVEPFLLRQFVADLNEITGAPLPADILPDIKVGMTQLEYQTENKSLSFTSNLEVPIPLPFLTDQAIVLGSYIDLHLKKKDDKYDISFNFSASIEINSAVLAVEFNKDLDNRVFTGGWRAVKGENALGLEKIAHAIGIELDTSALPALLNPQFCEIAFSYSQSDNTFALSGYTTNGTDYFFVARKSADAKWHYVFGMDYDAKSTETTGDIGELTNAANAAGLTQLHLLYAGADLQNFKSPRVPDITGKSTRQLVSGKLLNVKKGIFIVAEINNISLPQIGKLQADLRQFYISVEKQEQVVVLVNGNMDFMADGQSVNIALQAGYSSGAKDLSFQGKITAKTGMLPLLNTVIGNDLQLPEDISWPDISEAKLAFSTSEGNVEFNIKTTPERNSLSVAGLFSIGADQISLNLSKTKADFLITGGHLRLDVLNPVFSDGIGGSLSLHLEAGNNSFLFTPSGFEISTPAIKYQECQEAEQVGGKTEPKSITRNLCAKLTPGVFSFKQQDKQWSIAAEAVLEFQDFPDPVRRIFMEEKDQKWVSKPLTLSAGQKNGTLFFAATGNLLELEIPDLMVEIGATGLPAFGKSAIRVLGAEFHIGKDIALDLEFGYALPMRLNEVVGLEHVKIFKTLASLPNEQFTRFNLTISSSGISGKLLDSPFYLLSGITEDGDKVHIDLDQVLNEKDLGRISFIKPVISLDAEKGTFKFKGGYEIDPLRPVAIPLTLLRKLFEALKLNQVAKKLPKSIPVKTMKLDDTLHWLIDLLGNCGIALPDGLSEILLAVQKIESSLPARFRGYLSLSIPQSLDASIDVTADGGIGFSLTTTGDPLQFLVPTPLAFIGLRLTHISLGTAMGGSLLKFECSADLDTFDYAELLLSATIYQSELVAPKLPPRDELQHTFSARELLILIVYETGLPVPIPLFYQNLFFKFKGIEGLDIHTSISFPKPKVNVMKVLKIVGDLKKLFSEGKDLDVIYPLSIQKDQDEAGMNLVFDAGPFYIRLPKYITTGDDGNGRLFGWTSNYRLLDLMNLAGILLNGINHLIKEKTPAYLVQALPLSLRHNDIKIVPLENLEASVSWLMATPKEVISLYNSHQLPSAALEEIVPLLNLLTFQPSTTPDIKAVTAPENAVLFFMQGTLKVGSIADAKLSAALCWLPDGLASSMLIHVAAPDDILLLHLDGKQAITQSNFQVAGNATLKLLGLNIFQGSFIAAKGMLFLEASAFYTEGSPIGFYGKVDGIFNNDLVKLYGEARFKFFFIETSAKIYLDLNNGPESFFCAESEVVVNQVFSGRLKFKSFLAQNSSFDATVDFELKVLNIFRFAYNQKTHIDPNNIQFQGEAHFFFLNQDEPFLSSLLKYDNGTFSVATQFVLLNILRIQGGITIKDNYFYLAGELSFDLAGITTQGFIEVLSDSANKRFKIEIRELFGPGNSLKFSMVNTDSLVEFSSINEHPISVLNGALLITDVDNEEAGPKFAMAFDNIGMRYLLTDAKISAFGLAKCMAKMQYSNDTRLFSTSLHAEIDTNIVQAKADFNMLYSTNLLKLTGGFHLSVDLGVALSNVFSYYFKVQVPDPHFIVQFQLTDFEFSIENSPIPPSPDVREMDKAIEELDKRITEINALSETALKGLAALFYESKNTVAEIDKMLNEELTQGQRDILVKWKNKLPKNMTDIQPFINTHNLSVEQAREARLKLNDAKYKYEGFDNNWQAMLECFNRLDNRAAANGIDWSGNFKQQMMWDVDNTLDFMWDVLQNTNFSEAEDIHEHYYGKHCYKWIGNMKEAEKWIEIKNVDLENRKAGGRQWRKDNFDTIMSNINTYENEVLKHVNLFNNKAIPIMKADLLQSHIDMKLVNTYKKSAELAKYELPLTPHALDTANANDMSIRVVFRAKAIADIPGLGNVSLGDLQISWAGVSDLGDNSTLWQHLQRALNAYMSQQLIRIMDQKCSSIWDIAAFLKRLISGGNDMSNDNDADITNMVAGFANIQPDVSKNMKDIIDNPPNLSLT
ncbi:MAG TPA: hypothetical protein VHA56_19695 [Mucilaginibacter sp.]|nr:hypothetical protein [Mucilaginibacter sp.]